jgi:1,4-dihydroxy-2-naphthoate octaprenyltransferase
MKDKDPSIIQMVRAQFLVGIIIPLVIATLTAVSISGVFHLWGFILVLIVGLGLHVSTDVYNDIYDTKQGADTKSDSSRNYFSGGSGVLIEKPYLMKRMYLLARLGLVLSFIGMIGLLLLIDRNLWAYVIIIYVVSAFFSKYYTAAPAKLGYRGFGEFLVWLSFGPLAIILACLSQDMVPQGMFCAIMPITGFTTLTILWVGQLVDLPNDIAAGKRGMVARIGPKKAIYGYMIIQSLLIFNTLILSFFVVRHGWLLLIALVPFIFLLPKIWKILKKYYADTSKLVPITNLNSTLYGVYSFLFILGLWLTLL